MLWYFGGGPPVLHGIRCILGFVKVGKKSVNYRIWLWKFNDCKKATQTSKPTGHTLKKYICLMFQNKRLEGEVEKSEQQIEKFKSNMKKIETENKVHSFFLTSRFCQNCKNPDLC